MRPINVSYCCMITLVCFPQVYVGKGVSATTWQAGETLLPALASWVRYWPARSFDSLQFRLFSARLVHENSRTTSLRCLTRLVLFYVLHREHGRGSCVRVKQRQVSCGRRGACYSAFGVGIVTLGSGRTKVGMCVGVCMSARMLTCVHVICIYVCMHV